MKEILVKDIIEKCNGKLINGDIEEICNKFSRDSRVDNTGCVYLGIKGEKFNGSLFYEEALENGAQGCILQDADINLEIINKYKDRFIIIVENVVIALQELAKYKRSLYNIPVIAVTGSVGKTSTRDIIASVLETKYKVLKTQKNHNNEIGLPLTMLELKDHNAMVLEMGMSSLGEISVLTKIAKPTTAVITTIGSSHIGNLGSRENILKAKLEILEGLKERGSLIINNDNDLLNNWNINNKDTHKHITYGINNKSDYMAENIEMEFESSYFNINIENKIYKIKVPVSGGHFIYNALAGICVGKEYGIDVEDIAKGIEKFELTKRRMEVIKCKNEIIVINDSYNASYESDKAALEYLSKLNSKRKIAILGDVLELGEFSNQMHIKIGEEVIKNNIDILITVGAEAKHIANKAKEDKNIQVYKFENNVQAIELVNNIKKSEDVILVKASNGMKFDEIVEKII